MSARQADALQEKGKVQEEIVSWQKSNFPKNENRTCRRPCVKKAKQRLVFRKYSQ